MNSNNTELLQDIKRVHKFLSDLSKFHKKVGKWYAADCYALAVAELEIILDDYEVENYIFLDQSDPYGMEMLLNASRKKRHKERRSSKEV